jgi:hypothetical protein
MYALGEYIKINIVPVLSEMKSIIHLGIHTHREKKEKQEKTFG